MITIDEHGKLFKVSVFSELTLADFKEFETVVTTGLKSAPKIKLLLNLANMTGFTVDVAWEDIKFTRAHAHDFRKIAIVTSAQWAPWLGWVSAAFTDAEVQLFEQEADANRWLKTK
jgi:hypothetical protein